MKAVNDIHCGNDVFLPWFYLSFAKNTHYEWGHLVEKHALWMSTFVSVKFAHCKDVKGIGSLRMSTFGRGTCVANVDIHKSFFLNLLWMWIVGIELELTDVDIQYWIFNCRCQHLFYPFFYFSYYECGF